jgi:hypothetical protein
MFVRLLRIAVILISAVLMNRQARGASIFSFQFSGNQTVGNILFDDSVDDANPDPQRGLYHNAIAGYVININGTPESGTGIPVFKTLQGTSGDIVVGVESNVVGGCGPSTDCIAFFLGTPFLGQSPSDFDLTFYYPANSFASDRLPVIVPSTGSGILRSDLAQFFLGNAASTSVVPIPEGSPLVQEGFGIVVLVLFRHSTKRQRVPTRSGPA